MRKLVHDLQQGHASDGIGVQCWYSCEKFRPVPLFGLKQFVFQYLSWTEAASARWTSGWAVTCDRKTRGNPPPPTGKTWCGNICISALLMISFRPGLPRFHSAFWGHQTVLVQPLCLAASLGLFASWHELETSPTIHGCLNWKRVLRRSWRRTCLLGLFTIGP